MTDNESYGVRVEKKIDSMQSDIRMLSDHVTRLTFINEAHQNMSAENRKDIDSIITRVGVLENKSAQLDGGLNVIRIALTLLAGVFIGVCTWVGSSIIQNAHKDNKLCFQKNLSKIVIGCCRLHFAEQPVELVKLLR